jgi:diacylglycerol O-acyltransferase
VSPAAETLSPLDSFFLYLESARTPMHGGSVGIFEGGPLLDRRGRLRMRAIRAEVDRRLYMVPKLRQRAQFSLLGEAAPLWVDDPDFDVARHVCHATLATPGTEAQLFELTARLMAEPLDRARPLWEIWIVDGLESGNVALIPKLHHSVADGLSGVELATVLLDLERHPKYPHGPARPFDPTPPPSRATIAARDLAHRSEVPFHLAANGLRACRHPVRASREVARYADAVRNVVTRESIAPPCSLNVQIGEGRRYVVVRQSMDELRQVERHFGGTLNDVLLSAVAGGVHRLLASRGERVEGRTVQVMVPVGLEHHGNGQLGNEVSAMVVRLPIGTSHPVDRLQAVSRAESRCKRHHTALVGDILMPLLEPWPQPALAAATQLVHHQPFFNLVVTNVPGPGVPLYAMGARLLEAFPIVPIAGNLSVGVAALSYGGQLVVGLLADPETCPDLDAFAQGIEREFAELVAASGGHHARSPHSGFERGGLS